MNALSALKPRLSFLVMILFLAACAPSASPLSETKPVKLFDEWPSEGFPNDKAHITAASLEKDLLTIKFSYQGGCQAHAFELQALTAFMLSQPPQGMLYLSHAANGDTCTQFMEETLTFDLEPLNQERNDPASAHYCFACTNQLAGRLLMSRFHP